MRLTDMALARSKLADRRVGVLSVTPNTLCVNGTC